MLASVESTRQPKARAGRRPAKPQLGRAEIVEAAVRVSEAEGIDRVTMRRIAAELSTGAASLYVYVRDTEDLHAAVLDHLLAGVRASRPRGDWQARLRSTLLKYAAVLFERPALARMALAAPMTGDNYLAIVDRLLGYLFEGGVGEREAAWAIDLLLLVATASAAEHATWRGSARAGAELAQLERILRGADPRTHPNVARAKDELMTGGGHRLGWHIGTVIRGLDRDRRRRKK
jgi:AcrR family transcriptional regulator